MSKGKTVKNKDKKLAKKDPTTIIAAIGREFVDMIDKIMSAYVLACQRQNVAEWVLQAFGLAAPPTIAMIRRMTFFLLEIDPKMVGYIEDFLQFDKTMEAEIAGKKKPSPNLLFASHELGIKVILASFFLGSTEAELKDLFSELFRVTTDKKQWVLNLLVHTYIFTSRREWIDRVCQRVFNSKKASYDALLAGIIRSCHTYPRAPKLFEAMLRGGMVQSAIALGEVLAATSPSDHKAGEETFDPTPIIDFGNSDFDFSGDTVEFVMPPFEDDSKPK